MTISEAAHFLGIKPQSVYKKIYRQIVADGATHGPLFDGNGILTAQAEAVVRRLASCQNLPTEARGETIVSSELTEKAIVRYDEKLTLAAYARLQAEHEVLRQELERVTQYLDDCDRLLGEMCRTINALEERQYRMEQEKRQERRTGPLEALVRMPQVFYSNVLRRQTG